MVKASSKQTKKEIESKIWLQIKSKKNKLLAKTDLFDSSGKTVSDKWAWGFFKNDWKIY